MAAFITTEDSKEPPAVFYWNLDAIRAVGVAKAGDKTVARIFWTHADSEDLTGSAADSFLAQLSKFTAQK